MTAQSTGAASDHLNDETDLQTDGARAGAAGQTGRPVIFSAEQARVIAVLLEKSITTPKYYPMTVNGITQGCNQKTSRAPVMSLTEGEVGQALTALLEKGFVRRDDSSARATKWSQRLRQQLELDEKSCAVFAASVLRGPQTRAELRTHAEGLHGPATAEELDEAMLQLMTRDVELLTEFERQPGQKEARLMHLACGEPALPAAEHKPSSGVDSGNRLADLEGRVAALEAQLKLLLANQ